MGCKKNNIFLTVVLTSVLAGMFTFAAGDADAKTSRHHHAKHRVHHKHAIYVRPQPASFIVDADTGTVMQSENAEAPRYPASLTKMMTLYLAFEALSKNKLSLNDMIPVSTHAASQPQTNISLQPGERIAVKDAILSIVVRSANDSAVTIGEALAGGSEDEFAKKMTQKARVLGMKHTVFQNASGLPDPEQHTTARDMAILGLALRKNYPQYFKFFKTESFSYRGLTYVTHNHVMTRYEGVDGIKTGYIRASGYNLVTSATRDNHHIIGVVLGGNTFRERDDLMIALLDKTFTRIAALPGSNRVQYASSGRHISAFPSKAENFDEAVDGEGDRRYEDAGARAGADSAYLAPKGNWGIKVGAFADFKQAEQAANHAVDQAPIELKGSAIAIAKDQDSKGAHHALLTNLTQNQAEMACEKLVASHQACLAYPSN